MSGFLVPDCGNCGTCYNRCVQRLTTELLDVGAELVERRRDAECAARARWVSNAAWVLLGMCADPLARLIGRANALPPGWELLVWGGLSLLLFWLLPRYESILRKSWSPSRGW